MKQKRIVLFLLIIPLAEFLLGWMILKPTYRLGFDTVRVNELVNECGRSWESLRHGNGADLPDPGFPYAVLSDGGSLLYSSHPGISASRHEAVAHGDTILDISLSGRTVGKLILYQTAQDTLALREKRLFFLLTASAGVFVLAFLLYTAYLENTFFRPFKKLRAFASQVAEGKLDMPLRMDKKNVFGAFTESFDLMREELHKAQSREREANESKKELVAQLSHDIKTPVASIRAVAELMQVRTGISEKEHEQLSIIEAKAAQIDDLVSNLFHAALEELQELSVHPAEQDSRILYEMLSGADYDKKASIEPVPECLVQFDRLRLQQVFDNLFVNSYKYAGTGIRVTFSLEGAGLSVCIRDFGPGVDREELLFLTDKFYRGANSEGKSGAGLGLYLSRWLTEQMGGTLECRNLEVGFCVIVRLKLG